MKNLSRKVALITGAGGGLGSALAAELAGRGCELALVDIDAPSLERLSGRLADAGGSVSTFVVDITDPARVEALFGEITDRHGGVDILINNAGITLQKSFATHSPSDWRRVIDINLLGTLNCCQFFLNAHRPGSEGHIVNLSSMAASLGLPTQSSYSATKAAVKALSESLYAELRRENIGVTAVQPGAIKTDMIQATLAESDDREQAKRNYELAQRWGVAPEAAARKIVRAIEGGKACVKIGADAHILDAVSRLMPVSMMRLLARVYDRQQPSIPSSAQSGSE